MYNVKNAVKHQVVLARLKQASRDSRCSLETPCQSVTYLQWVSTVINIYTT